jgi:serine/threonine protein kinase
MSKISACIPENVIHDAETTSRRVNQMGTVRRKGVPIDDFNRFLLAEAINSALPLCSPDRTWKFKKQRGTVAPYSFIIDPQSHLCFILGDEITRGGGKKIRNVRALPFDSSTPSYGTVAKINLIKKLVGGQMTIEGSYAKFMFTAFQSEVNLINQSPLFPHSYLTFEYKSEAKISGRPVAKIMRIEERMEDSSTIHLFRLSPQEQLSFVRQVLHHIAQLWPNLHGDVKTSNVLFKRTKEGIEVRLIDLGLFCCPKKGTRSYIMDQGFYGSIFCTAPEAVDQDPDDINWYKAEAWAVGCALYSWLTRTQVPWGDMLEQHYKGRLGQPAFDYEGLRAKVRSAREPLQRMAVLGSTVPIEIIARVCLDLLDLDSERRPNLLDAKSQFSSYAQDGIPKTQQPSDDEDNAM